MSHFSFHLILQIISYHVHSADSIVLYTFPIQEFFDVYTNDVEVLSKYVCTYKPYEEKYCTCTARDFPKRNWCIDVFWKDKDDFTLDTYIEYLKEKYLKMLAENGYLTCEPVIYPLKTRYLVQRTVMHSTYVDENNVRKKCVNETNEHRTLSMPVSDKTRSNIYINEYCAVANNVNDIKRFELLAICDNIEDLQINMTLTSKLLEKLGECEFSFRVIAGVHFKECAREENGCPENDEYYVLCNAYIAPTNGYRNRHCYICANRNSTDQLDTKSLNVTSSERNGCRKDTQSICMLGIKYEFSNRNAIHIDYADETKELKVARLEYVFPAQRFFKDYKHGFHPQTKLKDDVCCFNKDSCWKFKSCCANKLWDSSRSMDLDLYKELLINSSAPYKDHHCELLVPHSASRQRMGYFMITTCLSTATEDEVRACTTVTWRSAQTYMPVVGEDNYLYRNSFCALCNSIKKFRHVEIRSIFTKQDEFHFRIEKNYGSSVRLCDIDMPSNNSCPSGHPYEKLCKSFSGPTQSYRNIFCHLCNHPNDRISFFKCHTIKFFFTWSMMITLDQNGQIQVSSSRAGDPTNELAQFLEKRCMGSECDVIDVINISSSKTKNNSLLPSCVNYKKDITLYVIKKDDRSWNNILTNVMFILKVSGYEFQSKIDNFPVMRLDFNLSLDQIITKYDELYSTLLKHNNTGLILSHKYESTVNTISALNKKNGIDRQKVCQFVERLNENKLASSPSCMVNNMSIETKDDLYFHHLLDNNGISTYIGKCKKYLMLPEDCRIKLNRKGKINDAEPPSSIMKKIMIKPDDFGFPSWGTYTIDCPMVETTLNFHEVEGYLSNIGTFVSITCYAFLIFTYRINNRLWNIPGQLLVALSSSLLVGDTMYLVAWFLRITGYNQVLELCETIGVTMHLSLVIAHALNVVIGFDMVMRFTWLNSRWFIINTKKLLHVIFGVLFLSVVLIIVSILCDYFNIILIGYGRDGICVPSRPQGRLYFYILPVAITFLLSLLCIFVVLCNIWRDGKRNKRTFRETVGRRNINLIVLTLKLTFALGLIEGIGFIQVIDLTNKPMLKSVFSLLYSLVRSLRGLILVLVFVCRKDVLQEYREKFKRVDIALELRNLDFSSRRTES